MLLVRPDTFCNKEKLKHKNQIKHYLLLVGSLLQLGELDLDERLQVKTSSRRSLCSSFKSLLGAALDRLLVDLLRRGLLDHLVQGGGFYHRRSSLLGASRAGLQLVNFGGSLLCSFLDFRLGCGGFLGASFGSLLGRSRVLRSHSYDVWSLRWSEGDCEMPTTDQDLSLICIVVFLSVSHCIFPASS